MSERSIYSRENEGIHHLKRVQDSNRKGPGPSSSPMISSAGVDPFLVFWEAKVPTWMSQEVVYSKMVGK